MPVLLGPTHLAALHAAFDALLAPPTAAPTPAWVTHGVAALGAVLDARRGTGALCVGDAAPRWYDHGPTDRALRALADPARVPPGAAVRQPSHDVATWSLDGPAPGRAAIGMLYETVGFRLHVAFARGTDGDGDGDGAHRSRVLLDLIAPVLAAGARARAHGRPDHAPAGAPPRVAAGHPLDHAPTVDDRAADALATALADDYALTAREAQAARYLIQGCTNVALARALGISENTARHHTERVIAKLGVRSRAEVAWAAVGRIRTPAAGTAVVAR